MVQTDHVRPQAPVRAAPMSEHHVETALTASFDADTAKLLRDRHATAWSTTRFERSLRLPVSSMARRAMMLWITGTLDEWCEPRVDGAIDAWCDVIARDHHGVAHLPGRPPRAFEHMSRSQQTPVDALRFAVAQMLAAFNLFRAGDVVTGRVDGVSVYYALRERAAQAQRKIVMKPAPTAAELASTIPDGKATLMKRHGGTATADPPPKTLSLDPTGKPRAEPDEFDEEWRGPTQPADPEPATSRPPGPRWRYRKPT